MRYSMGKLLEDFLESEKTSKRYEIKFVIDNLSENEVYAIIRNNPAMFSEIYKQRQVNNIYFDAPSMKNYVENVRGHLKRVKTRIRWYGDFFGFIEKPVLELKIKTGSLVSKLSYPLNPFKMQKNFSFGMIKKEIFAKSKLPSWVREKLYCLLPVLFNAYKRRYFLSSDKRYRITVDTELSFFAAKNQTNKFLAKTEYPYIIIELKFAQEDSDQAHHITQFFPFRINKNSKYVAGIGLVESTFA